MSHIRILKKIKRTIELMLEIETELDNQVRMKADLDFTTAMIAVAKNEPDFFRECNLIYLMKKYN